METFPVFQAAQRGLIDQDTCYVLLESQLIMGGLLHPDLSLQFSLEQGLSQGLIDTKSKHSLSQLERALLVVKNTKSSEGQQQNVLSVSAAMEHGLITQEEGLRILELQLNTGGLRTSAGLMITLKEAEEKQLLTPVILAKLQGKLQHRELVDPNTAEQLNLYELRQRCVTDRESQLLLLPVQQQPGGTVCLSSGKIVGIFSAVQEGLIDRKVAVRLLEAQLFAGGIVDHRSGDRLTVNEALCGGLMDQELACALFARQLQNGGILNGFNEERLHQEESIYRDLLSSGLAPVVLESLCTFAGMLWPESGEIMPIFEALQQGVISGELSRNILKHRHVIGALYNPETLQLLPLTQPTEQYLDPSVVLFLKGTIIPNVLSTKIESVIPEMNQSSWDSTWSFPPSLPPLPSGSSDAIDYTVTSAHFRDPKDELKHRLMVHLVAHSYVDAHTGKRLLLLDPELNEMVKANLMVSEDLTDAKHICSQSTLPTYEQGKLKVLQQLNLIDKDLTDTQQPEADQRNSPEFSECKESKNDAGSLEETNKYLYSHSPMVDSDSKAVRDIFDAEGLASPKKIHEQKFNDSRHDAGRKTVEEEFLLLKEPIFHKAKTDEVSPTGFPYNTDACVQNETVETKESMPITPPTNIHQSTEVKESQDRDLEQLARELRQEGLLSLDGNKLLPDEAVAQDLLSGYMAVKLMAEANLFGGFVDGSSGKSLTLDDVTQDLLEEDLMWRVLKADKTLSGVVDVDKNHICSITEASQTGLIDPNTAARLLEAQVVSGGIVDLRQNEKVSVTTAAILGLIAENQKEDLVVFESAYKGKKVDSAISLTKASLQLQIDGVVDPETKSPVPLEQAIQNKLIKPDDAYQILKEQVAEGGIVHHASGLRLSVSDAVDRGLVNRSVASGLQELEWIFKGKMSPSSHPEAFILQASTGAIFDPDSGCKLTLTEAVSKGLVDDSVADKALSSSVVTQGVLDPQSARIVPFSELVKQGKIDLKTGHRFLAVKPFRGIQGEKKGVKMTLPEAVAAKKVDPIPSFRLLQSQANSGGIVDIATGERLSLYEAHKRGLIEDNDVRLIATSQFLKGGIDDPVSGKQISNLDDAVDKGLISSQIALDILQKTAYVEVKDDEGSSTSLNSTNSIDEELHTDLDTVIEAIIPELSIKKWERISEQIQEEKEGVEKGKTDSLHKDKDSVKAKTTATVDLKECSPSDERKISLYHEPDERNVETVSLTEEIRDKLEREDAFGEFREVGQDDTEEEQADVNVEEKPAKTEIKLSLDDELRDQRQTSPLNAIKSKRKKKDKKNKKEACLNRKELYSQIDQVDAGIDGQSDAVVADLNSNNICKKSLVYSQAANALKPNQDKKIPGNNLVKQSLIADLATLKHTEHVFESQKDQVKAALAKTTENGKTEGLKKEQKKDEVEEKPSLSQETERLQPAQDVKKRNEVDLPQKHPLSEEEKTALILKAKDSILKKGFVKGVSEKQTVTELQRSRSELAKKESQHPAVRDLKFQTLSSELSGEGNHNDKDNSGRRHQHSSQFENTVKSKESKLNPAMVKEDAAVEGFLENGTTKTVPLKTSSEEQGKHGSPKEYIQEIIETDQLGPSEEKNREIFSEKQSKKNKIPKVRDAEQKNLLSPENMDSEVATISTVFVVEQTDLDKSVNRQTDIDDQSASDKMKASLVDELNKTAISAQNIWHSPSDLNQPEESTCPPRGHQELLGFTSPGQEQLAEVEKSIDFSQEVLKSYIQPTTQFVEFGAKPATITGDEKIKTQQPPAGSNVSEITSVESQKQNSKSSELAEDNSVQYESTNPACDTATDSWEEVNVKESDDTDAKTRTSSKIRKVTHLFTMCDCYFYTYGSFCIQYIFNVILLGILLSHRCARNA